MHFTTTVLRKCTLFPFPVSSEIVNILKRGGRIEINHRLFLRICNWDPRASPNIQYGKNPRGTSISMYEHT